MPTPGVPETLQYVYTTQAEIERVMSTANARLAMDDDGLGAATDPLQWTDEIADATDLLNIYCQNYYAAANLASSNWVRRRCTWIAAHLISSRRGNPGAFAREYRRSIEWLEKVQDGLFQIPRIPQAVDYTPALSNYVIDDRFPVTKIRVERIISIPEGSLPSTTDQAPYPYWPSGY